jgi:DNA-binding GntR family transcriptional regulator
MSDYNQDARSPLPLRPNSLREQIRESIRRQLQHSEIGIEDRLVDVEIANRLGVSRMPVREALLQLVNEGYLVGTTRGFVVPRLSLQDIKDIFEVRKLLEPRAAANAARHLRAEAEVALRAAAARSRRAYDARDVDEFALANMQFRQIWLAAEPNWRLAATIQRFADQVQTVRLGTLHDPATQDIVIAGVEGLIEAFVRRDADAAEARMRGFIGDAEACFFRVRAAELAAKGESDVGVAT